MNPCLFDVLHDTADNHLLPVGERIDVHFAGVVQEAVKQDRRIVRYLYRLAHVAFEIARFIDDFHRPTAQHIRGTHDQRVPNFLGESQRLAFGACGPVGRLPEAQIVQQFLEAFAVFSCVDHVW